MDNDLDRRIRERAYEIWENEGQPEGRSHDHWEQARSEFEEARQESAADAPSPAKSEAISKPKAATRAGRKTGMAAGGVGSDAPSKRGTGGGAGTKRQSRNKTTPVA
jgi:hypothetical protein